MWVLVGLVVRSVFLSWKAVVTSRVTLSCWFVISVWVAFAGPFGTYEVLPLTTRAVFWSGLIALGICFGVFFRVLVTRFVGERAFWPAALLISALNAVAFTPPLTFVVAQTMAASRAQVPTWIETALFVFTLTFGVAIVRFALKKQDAQTTEALPLPAVAVEPESPKLVLRLGPALRGDLLAISVRDHYVDVRTVAGVDQVLMRFADAILETEGVEGAQVHRSHWVAWGAVRGVERDGGNLRLRLSDGQLIPVSRANICKLEQRGLI